MQLNSFPGVSKAELEEDVRWGGGGLQILDTEPIIFSLQVPPELEAEIRRGGRKSSGGEAEQLASMRERGGCDGWKVHARATRDEL